MPAVYERVFKVRHYECDAYGHVNHANYLRYMQEVSLDASIAIGYTDDRFAAMGLSWLIRETSITYYQPLRFGDSVNLKTWVADVRRARLRRKHELRHTESGDLVAEAQSDWVMLNNDSSRPVRIPGNIIEAYIPGGAPDQALARDPFPAAPPPPPGIFKTRRRAQWRDIDPVGHVNNATYLAYLEDIGVDVCAAHGWPMTRMMIEGFGIVARRLRIEYRQAAVLGDEMEIATWASDAKRATVVRHYNVTRLSDGAQLARASVLWVWVDLKNGRPIRIPPGFLTDFAPNIIGLAA